MPMIAAICAGSSLSPYVRGAEDRYLVELYRPHVMGTGGSIAKASGLANDVHVGDSDRPVGQDWYAYFHQWSDAINTTKLWRSFRLGPLLPIPGQRLAIRHHTDTVTRRLYVGTSDGAKGKVNTKRNELRERRGGIYFNARSFFTKGAGP
jgi:hypothetical protein